RQTDPRGDALAHSVSDLRQRRRCHRVLHESLQRRRAVPPAGAGRQGDACLKIGDSMLMLTDEWPQHQTFGPNTLKGTPVTIHHYVPDVDASFKQAVDAGATVLLPVSDMFWGDRYGQLKDPF